MIDSTVLHRPICTCTYRPIYYVLLQFQQYNAGGVAQDYFYHKPARLRMAMLYRPLALYIGKHAFFHLSARENHWTFSNYFSYT